MGFALSFSIFIVLASSLPTFVESFCSLMVSSSKSGPFKSRSLNVLTNYTPNFLASVSLITLNLSFTSPNSDLALNACKIGSSNSPVLINLNPLLSLLSLLSFGSLTGFAGFCSLGAGLVDVGALILDYISFESLVSSSLCCIVADIIHNLNTNGTS